MLDQHLHRGPCSIRSCHHVCMPACSSCHPGLHCLLHERRHPIPPNIWLSNVNEQACQAHHQLIAPDNLLRKEGIPL